MGVAERIAIERKRLGLSQAEFASKAGVSLSSQKRYEKGERAPDSSYLEAIDAIGVDRYFINFGSRIEDYQSDRYMAIEWLLMELSETLCLERGGFKDEIDQLEPAVQAMMDSDDSTETQSLAKSLVKSIFGKSPLLHSCRNETIEGLNFLDCAGIVERFEVTQIALGKVISPPKKAQSIAMLWRVLRSGGKVDSAIIEEAVKLAAD